MKAPRSDWAEEKIFEKPAVAREVAAAIRSARSEGRSAIQVNVNGGAVTIVERGRETIIPSDR